MVTTCYTVSAIAFLVAAYYLGKYQGNKEVERIYKKSRERL